MNSGVYKIENKVNGKAYYGSTNNFKRRFKRHRCSLKAGKHENEYLQRSYNKHGRDSFKYEVIATCPPEYRLKLEQWFLDNTVKWGTDYNLSTISTGGNTSTKEVDMYSLDGQLLKSFQSIKSASEYAVCSPNGIGKCAKLGCKTWKGFIWAFPKNGPEMDKRVLSYERKNVDPLYQYDLEGNFIREWNSRAELKEKFASTSHIYACSSGKRDHAYKYQWSKEKHTKLPKIVKPKDYRKVYKYTLSGDYVGSFTSTREALNSTGKGGTTSHLGDAIDSSSRSASGFLWRSYKKNKIETKR